MERSAVGMDLLVEEHLSDPIQLLGNLADLRRLVERGSQNEDSRKRERTATLTGALAVCAGFLVLLFAFSR
jgi:hypothetical protein